MKNRYIKDGQVAVLYSPGFGAGWSTWCYDYPEIIFDPKIVEMILQDPENFHSGVLKYCEGKYPDAYLGGVDDLTICWLPEGTHFKINEYDGSESIEVRDEVLWTIA
jgi:hypothetical protein